MSEVATAGGRLFYGYAEELQGDAGDRVIEIDLATREALQVHFDKEFRTLGRHQVGTFLEIADTSGKRWDVASAPCGFGCHCAAVIREVK